jgi:hypothetical protein
MPKNAVGDWSTTAISNTDIASIDLGIGTAAISQGDNMIREMMAQIATWYAARWTDPAITGTILEDIYTISDGAAFEIDPGNGSIQKIVLGASRTPKATNFANGESILLLVDDGTSYALTWSDTTFGASGIAWKDGGSAPTLDATELTAIILWKFAGQVYGVNAGVFAQ